MAENPNALPSFVTALIAQIRAEDSYTGRQGFTDDVLIKPYLVTLDQRLRQQVIGDMTADLTAHSSLLSNRGDNLRTPKRALGQCDV